MERIVFKIKENYYGKQKNFKKIGEYFSKNTIVKGVKQTIKHYHTL